MQAALTQGMTSLTQMEARIKADSGNVNHMGIDIAASHNAYMDFSTQKGTLADTAKEARLGTAAQALVGDIGQAVASGQLSAAEVTQLQNVMAEIVGDDELAAEYIGISLHDGGAMVTEIGATTQTYVDSGNGVGDNGGINSVGSIGEKLRSSTNADEIIEIIRESPIERYDAKNISDLLDDIDNYGFSHRNRAQIKSEILHKAGFKSFDKKGSLADIHAYTNIKLRVVKTEQPKVLFRRGYPNEQYNTYGLGHWWSDKYRSIEETRNELGVCENWGNPLTGEYKVVVPQGIMMIEGIAAEQEIRNPQGNIIETRPGGGTQYWINDVNPDWIQ